MVVELQYACPVLFTPNILPLLHCVPTGMNIRELPQESHDLFTYLLKTQQKEVVTKAMK